MEYITTKNDVITGHYCGEELPDGAIEVCDFIGTIGEPTAYYNSDWTRKSDIELYVSGLKEIPTGFKLNDDKTGLVEISDIELYVSGLKAIPVGYKLNDDKIELVEMSNLEKLTAGIITQTEYNAYEIQIMKQKIVTLEKSQDRPLRALVLGIGTDQDQEKLTSIEKEIEALRENINSLTE
jgi:hypothetical protein